MTSVCSTLIAQAFQSVRYPILPQVERRGNSAAAAGYQGREIHRVRHYSLFAPRDFDISPLFQVVKPTLEAGFDHRTLTWADATGPDADSVPGAVPVNELYQTTGKDDA